MVVYTLKDLQEWPCWVSALWRLSAHMAPSYESHLWDSFLYGPADADFAGPAVTLRCPDIL